MSFSSKSDSEVDITTVLAFQRQRRFFAFPRKFLIPQVLRRSAVVQLKHGISGLLVLRFAHPRDAFWPEVRDLGHTQ